MIKKKQSVIPLLVALLAILVTRCIVFCKIPLCSEDAYITFHAVLDPSWHRAVTSPAWATLLSMVPPDPQVPARFFAVLGDLGATYAAWTVLPVWGFWVFIAFWIGPYMAGSCVSGLETHLVACALIMASRWPLGFTLAACLRPDAALLSLLTSWRRWPYAVLGIVLLAGLGLVYSGSLVPQTVTSKFHVYGVQGLKLFWWYSVPPVAWAMFQACRMIKGPKMLGAGLIALAIVAPGQFKDVRDRTEREAELWKFGSDLAKLGPSGSILLEPAGMIPYQNRQLTVIDDVGLTDPWIAKRREDGDGWRTDAIAKYKPRWIVIRLREYIQPELWNVGTHKAYRDSTEATLPGYGVKLTSGLESGEAKMISSHLLGLSTDPGRSLRLIVTRRSGRITQTP